MYHEFAKLFTMLFPASGTSAQGMASELPARLRRQSEGTHISHIG